MTIQLLCCVENSYPNEFLESEKIFLETYEITKKVMRFIEITIDNSRNEC